MHLGECPRCRGAVEVDVYGNLRCVHCGFAGPTSPAPPTGTGKYDAAGGPAPRDRMQIGLTFFWHDDTRPHWGVSNETVKRVEVTVVGRPRTVAKTPRFQVMEIITSPQLRWGSMPPRHRADFKRLLCEAIQAETSLEIKSINIPNALLADAEE